MAFPFTSFAKKKVSSLVFFFVVLTLSLVSGLFIYKEAFSVTKVKNVISYNPPRQGRVGDDIYLGQNIIVGIPGTRVTPRVEKFLREVKPAGVVFYARNFESFSQFKKLVGRVQSILKEETGYEGFIMLDEEPGGATRLYFFQDAFSLGLPNWKNIERGVKALRDLGINVELAPVADFPFNESAFVRRRTQAETPEDLIRFNRTFIDLVTSYGMEATLKHFPGLGMVNEDTHKALPVSDTGIEDIEKSILIFEEGIEDGANFVMTGHVIYEEIDSVYPATFSEKTVKILRETGFEGIVITDDISEMSLVENREDMVQAGIRSIEAGHNLIMFSHQMEESQEAIGEILSYVEATPQFEELVKENYRRVIELKKSR